MGSSLAPESRPARPTQGLPAAAWAWIGVGSLAGVGTGVMQVALTWSAAGFGGSAAGWVSAATTLPTVLLVLIGGAVGDRRGQRQVLLLTTGISVLQYAAFLIAYDLEVSLLALLIVNALASGAVAGFSGPSSTVYVRMLTPPELVPRAVAINNTASLVVRMIAPAVGGIVVGVSSLRGALWVNIAGFVVVLLALVLIRPSYGLTDDNSAARPSVALDVVEGLRGLLADSGLRVLIVALFFVAGSLLTISGLGLPLLVRDRGWTAQDLGVLEACVSAGYLVTGAIVAARDPARRPTPVMIGGILAAIASIVTLALIDWHPVSYVAALALGVGTVAYAANLSPVFVALSPADKLSRYSSVMYLAQVLPVLAFSPLIGYVAETWSASVAILGCAVVATVAPLPLATSRPARGLQLPAQGSGRSE